MQKILSSTQYTQFTTSYTKSSISKKVLWLGHFDPVLAESIIPYSAVVAIQNQSELNTLATDFDLLCINSPITNSQKFLFLGDNNSLLFNAHNSLINGADFLSAIQKTLEVLQVHLKPNATLLIYQESLIVPTSLSGYQLVTTALENYGLELVQQWGLVANNQYKNAFVHQDLFEQPNSPVWLAYLLAQSYNSEKLVELSLSKAQNIFNLKSIICNRQGINACDAWFWMAKLGNQKLENNDWLQAINLDLHTNQASGVLVSQNWQILKTTDPQNAVNYSLNIHYPELCQSIEFPYQAIDSSAQAFYDVATSHNWSVAKLATIVKQYIHHLDQLRPDFDLLKKLHQLQENHDQIVLLNPAICFYDSLGVGICCKTGQVKSIIPSSSLLVINGLQTIDLRVYLIANLLRFISLVPCFNNEIENRHYTRLQLVENILSYLSILLTEQNFAQLNWSSHQWNGDQYLPHQVISKDQEETLNKIESLEKKVLDLQTQINIQKQGFQIELSKSLENERQNVMQYVSHTYESTSSWKITKYLRKLSEKLQSIKNLRPGKNLKTQHTSVDQSPNFNLEPRMNYRFWAEHFDSSTAPHAKGWLSENSHAQATPPVVACLLILDRNQDAIFSFIEELKNQHYSHWTCTIAVFNFADEIVTSIASKSISKELNDYALSYISLQKLALCCQQDSRIKIQFLDSLHSTETIKTNAIFEHFITQTTANYFCVLQPTMRLRPQALDVLLAKIHGTSNTDVVYSDIDAYLENGQRVEPQFKPDWNPELFYSSALCPQVLHSLSTGLFVIKSQYASSYLAKSSSRLLSSEFLLLSLLLHVVEQLQEQYQQSYSARISHIPLVLSHHLKQTLNQGQRDEACELLKLHFKNLQTDATVVVTDAGAKVVYPIKLNQQAQLPLVSIVIPTRNNKALLQQCIESVIHITAYSHYEIIVIDNGSTDEATLNYFNTLRKSPKIKVIRDNDTFNYSSLNNHAVALASGEFIVLMNDDIQVLQANWLEEMLSYAQLSHIGAVGAKLYYPNYTVQHAGVILVGALARHIHKGLSANDLGYCSRAQLAQNFSALTAACLMVKKSIYEQLNGLNSTHLTVGWNDIDFCLRVRQAGYENVWTPHAQLLHHESATRGQDISPEKRARAEKENRYMQKTWGDQMYQDPAYNPNLTDAYDDFSYAWPPRV